MTTLQAQGQRLAKLEQHMDDHLKSCELAQATSLAAIQDVAKSLKDLRSDLAAEVKTLRAEVNELIGLKNKGIGAVAGLTAALSFFGALIIMGISGWVKDLVK